MNTTIIIILFIASYLLGSIPSGYVLTKLVKNIDIRSQGSKSTGATNTTRVLGLKYGILAMLMDALKGILIPIILLIFSLTNLYEITLFNHTINILSYYGLFAVIGHIFPIYLNFKGGKAVATSFGVLALLSPYIAIIGVIVFIIIVILTDYVSLSSILGSIIILIVAALASFLDIPILNNPIILTETLICYLILVIIIIIRHIPNIKRLINGNENKVSNMRKQK